MKPYPTLATHTGSRRFNEHDSRMQPPNILKKNHRKIELYMIVNYCSVVMVIVLMSSSVKIKTKESIFFSSSTFSSSQVVQFLEDRKRLGLTNKCVFIWTSKPRSSLHLTFLYTCPGSLLTPNFLTQIRHS